MVSTVIWHFDSLSISNKEEIMEEVRKMRETLHGDGLLDSETKVLESIHQELLDDYDKNGGFIYVKIPKGQKAGSIAKLVSKEPPSFKKHRQSYSHRDPDGPKYNVWIKYSGNLRWTGRSNKPKGNIAYDCNWLKDYDGPTVWKSESADDVRARVLETPLKSVTGEHIKVGDKVLYINARYGSGMRLSFGKITKIDAEYHSYDNTASPYVVVTNDSNPLEESRINNPEEFIYKPVEVMKGAV